MLLIGFIGVLNVILPLLYFTRVINIFDTPPYVALLFGFGITIGVPSALNAIAKRSYSSDANLKEHVTYDFLEELIKIEGESFFTTLKWDKIFKVKEIPGWILIYPDQIRYLPVSKTAFSQKQLSELKKFIKKKKK